MKYLFTILAILFTTSIFSQDIKEDSVSVDSYTTHRDSPDSVQTELTWEEMEELWEDQKKKKEKQEKVKQTLYNSPSVQEHLNQNKQDYRNYYYRNKRTTLLGLLLP